MGEIRKYWQMEVKAIGGGKRKKLAGMIPYNALSEVLGGGLSAVVWPAYNRH